MMKSYLLKREFFINNHKEQIKEHFDFIREVGRGAYGVAYQARQKVFPNRTRVVKRISKRRCKNPVALINQLKIMALLDHPHIVKVYETYEDQNSLFLVLDFCAGGELYNRLSSEKLFSESKARGIFNQMVAAVKYMHSQQVAHRDIKLQNFMMCNQHSWDIKIIDFGLSFHWKKDMKSQVYALQKGKIIGTPYYMSPEVLSHNYSEKCDIWSLGVILYMLVTGTPPFDGETDTKIMDNISKYNYSLNTPQCKALSPTVLDLISLIFRPENERISLEDILCHPWMNKSELMEDILLNLQFSKLMQFSKFAKLKKLVATYIASQLSESQICSIRDIFEQMDHDQDGFINLEELHTFLKERQGQNIAMTDLQKLVLSIDTDRNGKINYNQFIALCIDQAIMKNDDYLLFAFNSFDLNRDGKIQREEFQLILKAYSKDFVCNQELVDALISENDVNHDGAIDFAEFKNAMKSIRSQSRVLCTAMDIES